MTDPIRDIDVAISLMKEALAILEAPQNVAVVAQLKRAIELAEGNDASGKSHRHAPSPSSPAVEGLHRANPTRAADAPQQKRDDPKPKR